MSANSGRDPSAFYKPSIVDQHGNNPFADAAPPDSVSDNPYAAPESRAEPAYQPSGYETSLPHRSGVIMTFGLLGMAGVCISVLGALYYWPLALLNLALTVPPWFWGRSDLRAMRSGAMDATGRSKTKAGCVLGIIGTAASLLIVLVLLGAVTYRLFSESP
jgi:hypothetical protein